MCDLALGQRGGHSSAIESLESVAVVGGGLLAAIKPNRVMPPVSVVVATLLYCAEFINAALLSSRYRRTGDIVWMCMTILFTLMPAVLIQFTLTFVHRDLGRPLVILLHLLMLGPVVRCFEAILLYCNVGKREERYVTICRKILPKRGNRMPIEREMSQSERNLAVHRNAFERTSVIQAFLGSVPQLTLQLYATIEEKYFLPMRLALMIITLVSITYGAIICTVLAIQIRYDDYKVHLHPIAYIGMIAWRVLEIAIRVIILVLFCTALPKWMILVILVNLLTFFFLPWAEFWVKNGSLTENVEKTFSKLGTVGVLCMFTLLYAFINTVCWSAVQLDLCHQEVIEKRQRWGHMATYYVIRFIENVVLILLWYSFKSDFYDKVCTPMLCLQLLIGYSFAVFFMLVFHQYFHPCRGLFTYNVQDCLHFVCCHIRKTREKERQGMSAHSYSSMLVPEDSLEQLNPHTSQLDKGENCVVEDTMD